jgi:hypothetical protein
MTTSTPGVPLRLRNARRNTRMLLIQQQRVVTGDLPLPLFLRSPYLGLLWALVLSTVVAALALGRMRVPRTVRGVVVATQTASDSLTPILLLPSSTRAYVSAGQTATVDTGGAGAMTLVITSVEPARVDGISAHTPVAAQIDGGALLDSSRVVARLARCHDGHCLPLAAGSSYGATAALGSRSLASYAIPRS